MYTGILEQGLIFAIMAMGLYISYKILDFPDLTVDGSFVLGGAIVARTISSGGSPWLGLLLGFLGGSLAGFATGFLHAKLKVTNLLSGIIVMTGLYSINLRIMGASNVTLPGDKIIFSDKSVLLIVFILTVIIKILIDLLLKTKLGLVLKGLGDNETFIISLGVDSSTYKIVGLMIANGIVAFGGGVFTQYQGFGDISSGIGTIIIGLASIIIGERVGGKFFKGTMYVIIGSILYKGVVALTLKFGVNPVDIKLITSIITVIVILIGKKKGGLKGVRVKKSK